MFCSCCYCNYIFVFEIRSLKLTYVAVAAATVVFAVVAVEAVVLEVVVVAIKVVIFVAEQVINEAFVVFFFLFLQPMYRHIFIFEETS